VWTTVFLLGIAVNVEPTRIGLVPLLLARHRPLLQLLAYLAGSLVSTISFGLLVLFAFERNPFGVTSAHGGKAQIAVGGIAVVIAAFMAMHWFFGAGPNRNQEATAAIGTDEAGKSEKFTNTVRGILRKGRSPWLAGAVGLASGVPSVDFLAVLLIISTSPTSEFEKFGALATFVALGSLVVTAPLIGYLIAPAKTLDVLDRFGAWTRSRSRIEYAAILAVVGCLLIGLGAIHVAD
jgi:hypothetical protein